MRAGHPPFPADWQIESAGLLADTVAGSVHDVTLAGGGSAIVKQLTPKALEDGLRGADFLAWRNGIGCVRLLDRAGTMLLMEHAGKKTLRDHLDVQGDPDATRIAAEVLLRYHCRSDTPPPASLQPLTRYFASLFIKAEQDRKDGVAGAYAEAAALAETLLADQQDIKPLHGDLHHENIMHGARGWIVIDPAGLIGDAALDVANMFSNPLDRFDLTRDEARIAGMAEVFAETLGRDVRTILRYAYAYGCLSAAWHDEDGSREDRDNELAVATAVHNVLMQS